MNSYVAMTMVKKRTGTGATMGCIHTQSMVDKEYTKVKNIMSELTSCPVMIHHHFMTTQLEYLMLSTR